MYRSPAKPNVGSFLPRAIKSCFITTVPLLAFALISLSQAKAVEPQNAVTKLAATRALGEAVLPSFSSLVERVSPAVVSIRVKTNPLAMAAREEEGEEQQAENPGAPQSPRFQAPKNFAPRGQFGSENQNGPQAPFGPQPSRERDKGGSVQPIPGQGSGFFVTADGYIVTNNHVVDGALKIQVVRDTGDILDAQMVGSDPATDLALLKVDGGPFPAVALGSAEAKVGDWVIALGNPFGFEGTVTAGIVSARDRDIGMGAYDSFIQIDAPVNRGNSGGPTFNQAGEVIGVNTAIFSPSGGSVGLGFAIPAKTVEMVVNQLKEKGRVTRAWLGVQVQSVSPDLADGLGLKKARGALVSVAMPGGPADQAGIKPGDVILKINDGEVRDNRDFARQIAAMPPSAKAKITVFRDDKPKIVEAKLAELKDDENGQGLGKGPYPQAEIVALGLNVSPALEGPDSPGGLAIVSVAPDGRAADAGFARGDILVKAHGRSVLDPDALQKALKAAKAAGKGHALALVQRGNSQVYLALPTDVN